MDHRINAGDDVGATLRLIHECHPCGDRALLRSAWITGSSPVMTWGQRVVPFTNVILAATGRFFEARGSPGQAGDDVGATRRPIHERHPCGDRALLRSAWITGSSR